MSKIVRLFSGLLDGEAKIDEKSGHLDKPVMMVYCGKFESMDGPVEIKDEDIEKLVSNHNSKFAKLSRLANGEASLKHAPPIQLDHSTSARDTVGRLVGELTVGQYQPEGQPAVKAMYGVARFLGKENIERVQDGRWQHVSMGADLEDHALSELTVTPFPAAADAALLSKKRMALSVEEGDRVEITSGKQEGKTGVVVEPDDNNGFAIVKVGGSEYKIHVGDLVRLSKSGYRMAKVVKSVQGDKCDIQILEYSQGNFGFETLAKESRDKIDDGDGYDSLEQAMSEAKKVVAGYTKKYLSKGKEIKMGYKDTKEKADLYAKCKKHLMDEKKMSEEDSDKHLEAMDDDGVKKMASEEDERSAKMAADEKEKAEKLAAEETDKAKAEMSRLAALEEPKKKMIAMHKGVREHSKKVELARKRVDITTKLSKLRADGKITPAEIKKLNLDELSAKEQSILDATFKTYADREPVIDTGLHGTTKALSAGQLSVRLKKMSMEREELQTRLNMPSKRAEALARLAELDMSEEEAKKMSSEQMSVEHTDESYEKLWGEVKGMMDGGRHEEAKEHLRKHLASVTGPRMTDAPPAEDQTHQMSALAENMKKMQTEFDELTKLAAPMFGITPEELV